MDRSYFAHFHRKIKRQTCGNEREEEGEPGGEFDSLSAPPPVFPRNSRMRRKKARSLRVSFHSSGFVYPLPDKKALLARLSFVADILFYRGSRLLHHHYHHHHHHCNCHCYIRCVNASSSSCDFRLVLFRGKKRDE